MPRSQPQHPQSRAARTARALGLPRRAAVDDEPLPTDALQVPDDGTVVHRPDGYYWLAEDGEREFGPFDTLEEALADRQVDDEVEEASTDALLQVEDELGMSTWIDPDTGAPAEETVTRLEDH